MINKGFLTEDQLLDALAFQLGVTRISLTGVTVDPEGVKAMPGHIARRFVVFPVAIKPATSDLDPPTLVVAMTDPSDMRVIEALRFLLDVEIEPVLAGRKEILRAIEKTYGPDDPGSADKLPIPFPRSMSGRFSGGVARVSFAA
jgi:type IV pilus assembly protein PilB